MIKHLYYEMMIQIQKYQEFILNLNKYQKIN